MKKKRKEERQRERRNRQRTTNADESRRPSARWLRLAVVASCVVILTSALLIWNSYNGPTDSGNHPDKVQKAAILDGLYSESRNDTLTQTLTEYLVVGGYAVDSFRGENVTIDLLRSIADYKILILRLHSAIYKDQNLYIFGGEPYTESKYTLERLTGSVRKAVTFADKEYFAINIALLGANKVGGLKDSTIILMGCNGTGDSVSINTLLQKGVKTYFGWTGFVDLSHSDEATLRLVKALVLEKLNPAEAVEKTMAEVHPDPTYQTIYECFVREG